MKPDVSSPQMAGKSHSTKRIALINSIIARNDAVSASVRDTYHILASDPALLVSVFAHRNDFADVPCQIMRDTSQLLLQPDYLGADLIIWHAGTHYELFNAAMIGNGKARQVVVYHNTTPKQYLPESFWPLIEQALHQRHHLRYVDEIWADSRTNADVARSIGADPNRIRVIPLVVEATPFHSLAAKERGRCEILYVGRFVRSKGVLDLIEAVARLRPQAAGPIRVTLAGNLEYSDPDYVSEVRRAIDAHGLSGMIACQGTVDDRTLCKFYQNAHILAIPSYHEGFCKPVVEGLRAGCIPVGYDGYNLPDIINGLGRIAPTGDIGTFADALAEISASLEASLTKVDEACLPLQRGQMSVAQFDDERSAYVQRFTSRAVKDDILSRVFANLRPTGNYAMWYKANSNILVLPDDEMRERTRESINRVPDISDWEAGGTLSDRMREMNSPVAIHRKSWEYAICVEGLHKLHAIKPDARAIAVGAGSELPLFYFANRIERMVATDLYDNPEHEGTPAMLENPKSFAPFPYREDHLEVLRMPGDQLDFADATFDFAFCLSSIEHFGSRDIQRRSLAEMTRIVRPGGVLCIITELILTDHSHPEYFRWEEIEQIFLSHKNLSLVGGEPDLTISESLIRYPVDMDRSHHTRKSPHIVLKKADMLWTSFSMFLERKS